MFMIKSAAFRRLYGNYFITRSVVTVIEDDVFGQKEKFGHRSSNSANADIEELRIGASLFEDYSLVHNSVTGEAKQMLQKKTKWVADSNTQTYLKQKKKDKKKHYQPEVIDDPELGLEFFRLNLHDPMLSTLMTIARSRKRREKNREIIVEGRRFIREAVECQLQLLSIIFSQKEQLRLVKDSIGQAQSQQTIPAKIYKVPQHDLKIWSTLTTPPGVLALFQRPSAQGFDDVKLASSRLPITVVCDNIREPNNLGSIIRTCAALPCYQVVVTRGCCDPWESKALRGGCGGQFRIPIKDEVDWENLPSFIPTATTDNCCVFIAENNVVKTNGMPNSATVVNYLEIGHTGVHNVVVIGGESHGVSEQAYRFLNISGHRGKCLYIPLANGVESLNVTSALTLILYELRKNLLNHHVNVNDAENSL